VFIVGKILGTVIGFFVFDAVGAIVGFFTGHGLDFLLSKWWSSRRAAKAASKENSDKQSWTPEEQERSRQAFFTATFSIMGHLAKADGVVSKTEIKMAETIMARMSLSADMRAAAIKLFGIGKERDFQLDMYLQQFRDDCSNNSSLYRVFLETQIQAALADGAISSEEQRLLLHVARSLGFSKDDFRQMEMLVRVNLGLGDDHSYRYAGKKRRRENVKRGTSGHTVKPSYPATALINDAYVLMGLEESASQAELKNAYRKLMSEHHPDKLASKQLPESVLKLATDKTQAIQKANDDIKKYKGWK